VGTSVIVGGIRVDVSHKLQNAIEHAISVATIELAKDWPDKLGEEYRMGATNVIAAYLAAPPSAFRLPGGHSTGQM